MSSSNPSLSLSLSFPSAEWRSTRVLVDINTGAIDRRALVVGGEDGGPLGVKEDVHSGPVRDPRPHAHRVLTPVGTHVVGRERRLVPECIRRGNGSRLCDGRDEHDGVEISPIVHHTHRHQLRRVPQVIWVLVEEIVCPKTLHGTSLSPSQASICVRVSKECNKQGRHKTEDSRENLSRGRGRER